MTAREKGYDFIKRHAKKAGTMSDNYPIALGAIKGYLELAELGQITEEEARQSIYGVFDALPHFI